MPALNPVFSSVRDFQDFVDAYRGNNGPAATMNDLRRAWNILVLCRTQHITNITFNYREINVSQSSMRTTVSKLNQIFRFMGILGYRETIRIMNENLMQATINIGRLRHDLVPFFLATQVSMAGRGQDRTTQRHVDRHRRRWGVGSSNLAAALAAPAVTPSAPIANRVALISDALEGFNPFEGIDDAIIAILREEANS